MSDTVRRYCIFSKGLKYDFETAVVNEPSVFEPLKFYCIKLFVSVFLVRFGFSVNTVTLSFPLPGE